MGLLDAELPIGRRWACVRDFYEITRKPRQLNLRAYRSVPFIPMEAVPQGGSFVAKYEEREIEALSSGTYFERGDVLVAKITPSFENGKQAIADDLPADFGYATTEVIPLRAIEGGHDKRLLFYYLLHPEIRSFVADRMEGSTARLRVPEEVLLDLPYPELSTDEQVRVADVLQQVRKTIDAEDESRRLTEHLKQNAMRELFTRGLRGEVQKETEIGMVPKSWNVERLGAHHAVVSGGTPSRGNPAFWAGGAIPWVKTTEVDYCIINETQEHITQQGLESSAAKLLPAGTLLMAMYGQGVTRGKVAILGIEAACNQACAAITPTDEAVLPRYLYHFLSWRYDAIRSLAHGGQQQNLNLEIVRDLPLAYAQTVDEQQEIVAIFDALDRKIALHQQKRSVLEALFKALLHKLMIGEIHVANLDVSALRQEREPVAA